MLLTCFQPPDIAPSDRTVLRQSSKAKCRFKAYGVRSSMGDAAHDPYDASLFLTCLAIYSRFKAHGAPQRRQRGARRAGRAHCIFVRHLLLPNTLDPNDTACAAARTATRATRRTRTASSCGTCPRLKPFTLALKVTALRSEDGDARDAQDADGIFVRHLPSPKTLYPDPEGHGAPQRGRRRARRAGRGRHLRAAPALAAAGGREHRGHARHQRHPGAPAAPHRGVCAALRPGPLLHVRGCAPHRPQRHAYGVCRTLSRAILCPVLDQKPKSLILTHMRARPHTERLQRASCHCCAGQSI